MIDGISTEHHNADFPEKCRSHSTGISAYPTSLAEARVTTYTLTAVNNSTNYVDLCVYQTPPDLGNIDVLALAWFAEPAWPTTTTVFDWEVDYSFVWSQTGELGPGVLFTGGQSWPADPADPALQQVKFTYAQGAYTFQNGSEVAAAQPGSLYISGLPALPLKEASVGIGMSGAGTFAVQAQPRLLTVASPHPEYWITAGTFQQGQVIDIEQITQSAAVAFPPGVFAMTATLNADNSWTVAPN
jgi:rhizosphere induced protein